MQRSQAPAKSGRRKPLSELTNKFDNNVGDKSGCAKATGAAKCGLIKSVNPTTTKKKKKSLSLSVTDENNEMGPTDCGAEREAADDDGDSLDRLLLVQSDLSSVVHQIDELVAQAFKLKEMSKQGNKEVESLTLFLSEMLSSLKTWPSRLQKAFSNPHIEPTNTIHPSLIMLSSPSVEDDETITVHSPEQAKLDSLISPSPLVSWRANCTVERGRQVFMLTPLPISKALCSNLLLEEVTSATAPPPSITLSQETKDDSLKDVVTNPTPNKPLDSHSRIKNNNEEQGFVSPIVLPKRDCSMLVMTPCFKVSPPKSCTLLEPISESAYWGNVNVRKSTPFPAGVCNYSGSESSESSGDGALDGLATRYPELLGIQHACARGIRRAKTESSPDWFISPPKSCIVMEPPDEKSLNISTVGNQLKETAPLLTQIPEPILSQGKHNSQGTQVMEKSVKKETFGRTLALIEMTPVWKEPDSTQLGKRPGENTLKRELWTKFEAASAYEFQFNRSALLESGKKGFLERLEEVSLDGETPATDAFS